MRLSIATGKIDSLASCNSLLGCGWIVLSISQCWNGYITTSLTVIGISSNCGSGVSVSLFFLDGFPFDLAPVCCVAHWFSEKVCDCVMMVTRDFDRIDGNVIVLFPCFVSDFTSVDAHPNTRERSAYSWS